MTSPTDNRQYAPATERNRSPILNILLQVLPPDGDILEIASGTGEHAVFFAPHFSPRQWIPSDPDHELRASIAAWREDCPTDNLQLPVALDVRDDRWLVEGCDRPITSIININMIHISPWASCLGLFSGASRILPREGILYLYGPFRCNGQHTAPSNEAFDRSLHGRNPEWGVRDLEAVIEVARERGLNLQEVIAMPANNFSVVFRQS
jgi:hypothetical protein